MFCFVLFHSTFTLRIFHVNMVNVLACELAFSCEPCCREKPKGSNGLLFMYVVIAFWLCRVAYVYEEVLYTADIAGT